MGIFPPFSTFASEAMNLVAMEDIVYEILPSPLCVFRKTCAHLTYTYAYMDGLVKNGTNILIL